MTRSKQNILFCLRRDNPDVTVMCWFRGVRDRRLDPEDRKSVESCVFFLGRIVVREEVFDRSVGGSERS
jgi:hypothetical protein